jgi:intracellular multiplication protein IcmK
MAKFICHLSFLTLCAFLVQASFLASHRAHAQSDPLEAFEKKKQERLSSSLPSPEYVGKVQPSPNIPRSDDAPLADTLSGPFADLNKREPTPEEIEQQVRKEAFDAALTGLLPMRPEEIRKMLETYDKTREAMEKPIYPYPEPELVVQTVSLDPGSKPPTMKVAVNHVSTLNILDITGEPWPVEDITFAGQFEIVEPKEGSHVIRIIPMAEFSRGNLVVRLLDLKTPVVFTVETHRDVVQYRFDARIPEFGPYAQAPLIKGGVTLTAGSSLLNQILDGVPPEGAEKLMVSGVDGRTTAYVYQSNTYVRTPLTLLSPGWAESVSSADGMNVYSLKTSPVLLLSDGGQMVRAHVSKEGLSNE